MDTLANSSSRRLHEVDSMPHTQRPPKSLQKELYNAISTGQVHVVRKLLEDGIPLDYNAFIEVACLDSQEMWACLLEHGWSLNDTRFGASAMGLSIGEPSLVQWMLEQGANPNLRFQRNRGSPHESTALAMALAGNNLESMRILVTHGAVVESTLLEKCVAFVNQDKIGTDALQFLLDNGADPNAIIEEGRGTSLQLAVRRGMVEKAAILLRAGARMDVRNEDGLTVLEEAELRGDAALIELLKTPCR